MSHLILDLSSAYAGAWAKHHSGGLLIPADERATVLQPDERTAEREAVRLAERHRRGTFVVFRAVSLAQVTPACTHVNLHGVQMRYGDVVRLLPVQLDEVP